MLDRLLTWLQKTPVFFRVFFTFVIFLMAFAFLFTLLPGSHDGVGAVIGIVVWAAFLIWKRQSIFGPKLQ